MRFSYWPGAGNPWSELVDVCRHAESTGWDGIWFADHFMPNAANTSPPVGEAWTTIAGLAALVPRVRIGTLVTGNTYRDPAVLAKMAAGVDIISGGRLVLGLGAGWQENEHAAYGIPFYTVGGRLRRLEEACQVVTSLFTNDRTTFAGRYYQLEDAPLAPKPIQQPLPLLIGGGGEKVTMRIAAQYADEWNVWGTPDVLKRKMAILDQHCANLGRNPKTIHRSAQALLVLSDDPEVVAKSAVPGRPVIAGNVEQLQAIVRQYDEAGVDELIIPDGTLGRGEQRTAVLDRFINEVAAPFR
ncbi:MAG: LLM class F420-dependent oxidoreductase [Dehalococcoidia bacterium]